MFTECQLFILHIMQSTQTTRKPSVIEDFLLKKFFFVIEDFHPSMFLALVSNDLIYLPMLSTDHNIISAFKFKIFDDTILSITIPFVGVEYLSRLSIMVIFLHVSWLRVKYFFTEIKTKALLMIIILPQMTQCRDSYFSWNLKFRNIGHYGVKSLACHLARCIMQMYNLNKLLFFKYRMLPIMLVFYPNYSLTDRCSSYNIGKKRET